MSATGNQELLTNFTATLPLEPIIMMDDMSLLHQAQKALKRAIDFMLALIGIFLILPLLIAIALLIKATSTGPVLYKSKRVGRDFQLFDMYKFRTMHTNAEALWAELKQKREIEGELFKIKRDPRVIPVGFFLRKYSLDELPQLFNVLQGTMSLVGPRPFIHEESQMFQGDAQVRFNTLPGMTGLWQTSGRSDLNFDQLCKIDIHYVVTWTILSDVKILLRTIPTVLFPKGSY